MARLYNWDVKRRKDQKAVAANWKENLIQPKAEKKTWFSWKLKRKNMFQLKTEKTWNTRFSWSVINNSYSWSENNVQLIQLQCSADSITMFSRSEWLLGWSKYHVILIRIGVSAEKTFNTMMNRSTNSNSEVKENICQDDSYWSTADCQMEN